MSTFRTYTGLMNATAITVTNLNGWVRGTTTYKHMSDGSTLFIARTAEGFHLYVQADNRWHTEAVLHGTFATEGAARNFADDRLI